MNKFKLWKKNHYTNKGYLYLKTDNSYVNGVVGTDIKLTLLQKIQILFCKGVSVVLIGKH